MSQLTPAQYYIRDQSGLVYGPASLETLRSWILEGRVNSSMQFSPQPDSDFRPVTAFPDIQATFAALQSPPSPYAPPVDMPYSAPLQGNDTGLAIASLVCSLVGIFVCPYILCIVGVVLGHKARRRIRENPRQYGGDGMALAGIIIGYIMLGLSLLVAVGYIIILAIAFSR